MADSSDNKDLGGLARSIDALFAGAAPTAADDEAAAHAPTLQPPPIPGAIPVPDDSSVPEPPPIPEPTEDSARASSSSERTEAVAPVEPTPAAPSTHAPETAAWEDPWGEVEDAEASEPVADETDPIASPPLVPALGEVDEPAEVGKLAVEAPELEEPEEPAEEPIVPSPATLAEEPIDPPPLPSADEPSDASPVADGDVPERAVTTPEEGLAEAVEAFLSGEEGADERVDSIAAGLRERLVLDPLANAVERLIGAAGDPPDEAIVEMARTVTNPAVASKLVHRMGKERDDERRAEYVVIAVRLGRVMANAFRGAMTDATDRFARRAYYDGLIAMGDESRPVIEEMVGDENRFLVRNGVAILGEIGGDGAEELVTSALANTDARVRREALLAIGKLGAEDAAPLVVGCLDDPDPTIQTAAATAAGQIGAERAVRPLTAMLEGDHEDERTVAVLRALGRLGDPGAVIPIEKFAVPSRFFRRSLEVRTAAYVALCAIGTPHARELLEQAREDKEPAVRETVRELLASD